MLLVGTDQPENDWARMLRDAQLLDASLRMLPTIVGLYTAGTPLHLDEEGIELIASHAEDNPSLQDWAVGSRMAKRSPPPCTRFQQ